MIHGHFSISLSNITVKSPFAQNTSFLKIYPMWYEATWSSLFLHAEQWPWSDLLFYWVLFCLQRYLEEIQVLNETDITEKLNPKWRGLARETLNEPKSDVDRKAKRLYKTWVDYLLLWQVRLFAIFLLDWTLNTTTISW